MSFIENTWVSKNKIPLKFTTKDGFICEQFVTQTTDDEVSFGWKTNITPEYLLELLKKI